MSSIMTGIQLQDNFSSVLYNIVGSVNMATSSMYDMSEAMNTDIDTSSLEGAREEINQATMALNEMNAALENQPSMSAPSAPQVTQPIQQPIEPVIQWQSDNMQIFTNSGIERFEQEVQSTNTLLEQLSEKQNEIAKQAYHTNIFPIEMFQDLSSMTVRMDTLREKIQAIEANKVNIGTGEANTGLEQLRSQLNMAVQQQNELNSAMDRADISGANNAYTQLSHTVSNTEQFIRDNTNEQGRFNQEIRAGTTASDGLLGSIKGMAAAYLSIHAVVQGVKSAFNASDELTQTTARIDLMRQSLGDTSMSTKDLMDQVYLSAQDARGSFTDMASVVARFGNNAKDAFGGSEEVINFANLVQKSMTIAGASTQEAANAELQLSQALGSGVLRGDELNSIFEQAPNLIQNIADYMGQPIGKIREMASEGELSADIVKQAIFAASDDINAKFAQMPMTWGQMWQSFQGSALRAFQPVLQRMNDMANSEQFQAFVNGAIETLAVLSNVVLNIFDAIGDVGSFISDNWSIISPVIYGVIAALAVYALYLGIVKIAEAIGTAAKIAMCIASFAHAAATRTEASANAKATAAQYGLNTALLSCPLTWIIIMIIAVIAIIYLVVAAINKMAGTSISATGIICGAFAVAGAIIGNIFIGLINTVIGIWVSLLNFIYNFAAIFSTIFDDPVSAIAALFLNLFDFIVNVVKSAASMLDTIFGGNLADKVSEFEAKVQGKIDTIIEDNGGNKAKHLDASDYQLDRITYSGAWDAGYSFGQGVDDKVSSFNLSDIFGATEIPSPDDYAQDYTGSGAANSMNDVAGNTGSAADSLNDIAGDTGDTAADTARIADSIDITSEDLKYLRDIAEREIIDRTVFTKVEVNMGGVTNEVHDMADLDAIADKINGVLQEQIVISAEG